MTRINDIFVWSENILAPNLIHPLKPYQDNLISDDSSYLFGNAIIKQKRIKQGNNSNDNVFKSY